MALTDPFIQARLRLTAWYLVILAGLITGFTYLTFEAKDSAYVRVYTVVKSYSQDQGKLVELNDTYAEFNRRFKHRVLIFDVGLLIGSGIIAWWLAGKTLKPIQTMMQTHADFTANVSHGLRTPLTAMQLQLEAFKRTHKPLTKPWAKLLNDFSVEISHMTRIVEEVLILTRIKTTILKPDKAVTELNQILNQAQAYIKPLAVSKHQQLKWPMLKQPVRLAGNFDQLLQVIMILLDNAVKYTPVHGLIKLRVEPMATKVSLVVDDSGPGISQAEQSLIFKPYYRGRQSTGVKGSGLGLAIAGEIVKANGGVMEVKRRRPQGTSFKVTLRRIKVADAK